MRRYLWAVIPLVLLLGGALVADAVVRAQAEARIADGVTALPGLESAPEVSIGGFPFLTQLAAGELAAVHLSTPVATLEGLRLEEVVVELAGVSTQEPYTASTAVLTARTSPDAVEHVLTVDLDLELRGDRLVATQEVLGLPLDIVLEPRAAGREVEVDVTELMLAGLSISTDALPADLAAALQGLRFPVDGLPPGMVLTEVTVAEDGVWLRAEGAALDLTTTTAAP